MPAPKKLVQPLSNGMPAPPPKTMPPPPQKSMPPPPASPKFISPSPLKTMPPPPAPPKFISMPILKVRENDNITNKSESDVVPDTLIKLMEYGEEDDDLEESEELPSHTNSNAVVTPKPFWAL